MKRPVLSFEAEVLTDAPFDLVAGRLRGESPRAFKSLRPLGVWTGPAEAEGVLRFFWTRRLAGAEESGELALSPDSRGARLRVVGRMRGWSGFLLFGWMRWRTDRLLDRFVEEL